MRESALRPEHARSPACFFDERASEPLSREFLPLHPRAREQRQSLYCPRSWILFPLQLDFTDVSLILIAQFKLIVRLIPPKTRNREK